jgi:hypothetical protein
LCYTGKSANITITPAGGCNKNYTWRGANVVWSGGWNPITTPSCGNSTAFVNFTVSGAGGTLYATIQGSLYQTAASYRVNGVNTPTPPSVVAGDTVRVCFSMAAGSSYPGQFIYGTIYIA